MSTFATTKKYIDAGEPLTANSLEILKIDYTTLLNLSAKMGFKTIAIARGKDEEELVKKLGARQYIDNRSQNAVEELNKLGGAKVILATVSSGKAMSEILGGLAVNGKLVIIGASDEPIQVPSFLFISGRRSLRG